MHPRGTHAAVARGMILAAAVFALISSKGVGLSMDGCMLATVARPTTVPVIARSGEAPMPTRGRRLVISVEAFHPSSSGPVTAVATVHCGADVVEVGRWGVFPDAPFVALGTVRPMRFGFSLPDTAACDNVRDVTVSLVPSLGDGSAASLTIRSVEIL